MPEVRPLARSSERSAVQGDFPNGVLPSEDEIAASLGVTVRDALSVLEADRLVRRLQGIGTRMNEHVLRAPSLSRLAGFHEQISEAGYEPQIASTTIRTESASRAVLERLGRLEPLDVYAIERLFLASGAPVVHVVDTFRSRRRSGRSARMTCQSPSLPSRNASAAQRSITHSSRSRQSPPTNPTPTASTSRRDHRCCSSSRSITRAMRVRWRSLTSVLSTACSACQ